MEGVLGQGGVNAILELRALPQRSSPLFADKLTVRPSYRRQRVVFVCVERDIFHRLRLLSRLTPSSVVQRPR